jgi:hypothetical protein
VRCGSAGAEHLEGGLLDGFCLNKQAPRQKKQKETRGRRSRSVIFTWDGAFWVYFVARHLALQAAGRWALGKLQGAAAAEQIKRENDAQLRQLFFFLVRFWAFLGKGSPKTREKNLSIFLLRWLSASR